jgi:hypothetical protein
LSGKLHIYEVNMSKADLIDGFAKVIDELKDPQILVDTVLSPIDNEHESFDDATKRKCLDLLGEAEEKIRGMGDDKREWWLSEIYMRKARCSRGIVDRKREYSHWKDARSYANQSDNHEMRLHSSLELGFGFVEFTSSLREMLEIQMDCVRAICAGDVATTSRLRIIGINLYDFWRQLEYRRLSEHDLKAKQFVLDSAKSLESAGFDDETAAPVMILLISKVFDFDHPTLEWAQMEAGVLFIPIPEDVKEKLA